MATQSPITDIGTPIVLKDFWWKEFQLWLQPSLFLQHKIYAIEIYLRCTCKRHEWMQ